MAETEELFTVNIYHNGVMVKTFINQHNSVCAIMYFHSISSYSMHYNLKYLGYSIETISERTGYKATRFDKLFSID